VVRLEEKEQMSLVKVPRPKHPLKRYSTRQLKAWMEDYALLLARCDKQYDDTGTYPYEAFDYYDIAQWTKWEIEDTLRGRGMDYREVREISRKVHEDVQS
jgi:hypothetical protein